MENLGQGLAISITGLLITFGALGALIGLIAGLDWAFRPRSATPATAAGEASRQPSAQPDEVAEDLDEIAAAIGVAVTHFERDERPPGQLGATLASGPGPWWHLREGPEGIGRHGR